MTTDITPDRVLDILRTYGPGDVYDIAGELGVNHTHATLRRTLHDLAKSGQVVRSYLGDRDDNDNPVYRFELAGSEAES